MPTGWIAFAVVRAGPTTLLCAALLALAGCGGDEDDDGPGAASSATEPCEEASVPEGRSVALDPPPARPSADRLTAVVDTSCGTFEIALDTRGNPKTAASFEYLAENEVFDNTLWHSIVPGFKIQGGDPQATGSGGPGYSIDEPPPQDAAYTKGVVGMAKTVAEPPGRSGSQFFVVTGADAGLPPQYAIAGKVTSGFDVVKIIEAFGDPQGGSEGTPLEPVLIDSVTIERD